MILITGGGGLYGVNIAWYLASQGQEVLLLQRSSFEVPSFLAPFWRGRVAGVTGDIRSLPSLLGLVKEYHVESIVHLAAVWEGRGGQVPPHEAVEVNVGGTVNVLEAARIFGLRRVTFASSNNLYDGYQAPPPDGFFYEDQDLPLRNVGYIACTKKAAEQLCLLYAKEYGLSICLVRGGRGYGPPMRWGRMPLERMVRPVLDGRPADLTDLPENYGVAPVHVKDLARGYGLLHLAPALKHEVYNVSSGRAYTLSEVAQIVRELLPGAEIHLGPPSPASAVCVPPSIARAGEEVGYVPTYAEVRTGLAAWIDYLKEGKY